MVFRFSGRRSLFLLAFAVVVVSCVHSAAAQNWSRFRGDNGNGISNQKGLPTTWSRGDYKWKVKLPGVGHSSPVIWKDRLFVTSAIDRGAERYLFCLNAETGKTIWKKTAEYLMIHQNTFQNGPYHR